MRKGKPPAKVLICQTCGTPWASTATFCFNCESIDLVESSRINLSKLGVPKRWGHLGRRGQTGRPRLLTDRELVAMDVDNLIQTLSVPSKSIPPEQLEPRPRLCWAIAAAIITALAFILLFLPEILQAAGGR